ncbi:hypothetical protein JCM8547_002396 [Rhodosporidiobolus lusitaniae]
MSSNASSSEYDYSGDEYDYEDDAYLSDEPQRSNGATLPLDLEDFRKDWLKEVDEAPPVTSKTSSPRTRPPLPATAVSRVLINPDVLEQILLSSSLSRSDFSSAALVNTHLHSAVSAIRFRRVNILTPARAQALGDLFLRNPSLPACITDVHLSLGDPLSLFSERSDVKEVVAEKRALEEQEQPEYFWTAGKKETVERKPWKQRLHERFRHDQDPNDEETWHQARKRAQIVWASKQSEKYNLGAVQQYVKSQAASFPFAVKSDSVPAQLADLLQGLGKAGTVTRLTLSPPVSHFLPNLAPFVISTFPSLISITVICTPSCALPFNNPSDALDGEHLLRDLLHLPLPVVELLPGGRGLEGVPKTVTSVKLKGALMYWQLEKEGKAGNSVGELEDDARSWSLDTLSLSNVTIKRPPPPPPARRFFRRSHAPPNGLSLAPGRNPLVVPPQSPFSVDPFLHLDLCAFLGPSSRLTSLTLSSVSGIIPSSLALAISHSSSTLRHLHLSDLNVTFPPSPFPFPMTGEKKAVELVAFGRSVIAPFSLSPLTSSAEKTALEKSCTKLSEAAQKWWAVDSDSIPSFPIAKTAPSSTTSSLSLSSTLSYCTHLHTLHLLTSFSLSSNCPFFPPSILDALLVARPPLEVLQVRLGAEGPTREEGLLGGEGWVGVARKVEEVGGMMREGRKEKGDGKEREEGWVRVALRVSR